MCIVTGLGSQMARHIKKILIANPEPKPSCLIERRVDINTHCLTTEHIISATFLPQEHAVRHILAAASVEGYLRDEDHKFVHEIREYPTFGADVLQEVRKAMNSLKVNDYDATVEDPLSGRRMRLNNSCGY